MVDAVTQREQTSRDRLLEPIVDALVPESVRPNHVTVLRFCLVALLVVLYLWGAPLLLQLVIVGVAALTDTIDGVMARTRNQVTQLGSVIDHVADWMLGGWVGILALLHRTLTAGQIVGLLVCHSMIGVANWARVLLTGKRVARVKLLFHAFAMDDFEASIVARSEFVFVLLGLLFTLLGRALRDGLVFKLGSFFIWVAVGAAFCIACSAWHRVVVSVAGRRGRAGEEGTGQARPGA